MEHYCDAADELFAPFDQVPGFIKEGEFIKINTETDEYTGVRFNSQDPLCC